MCEFKWFLRQVSMCSMTDMKGERIQDRFMTTCLAPQLPPTHAQKGAKVCTSSHLSSFFSFEAFWHFFAADSDCWSLAVLVTLFSQEGVMVPTVALTGFAIRRECDRGEIQSEVVINVPVQVIYTVMCGAVSSVIYRTQRAPDEVSRGRNCGNGFRLRRAVSC